MKTKIKNNIKLILSAFAFSISALFFINTSMMPGQNPCKNCGSFDACSEGIPTNQAGYENCEIVPGHPPCEVSGYGECGGPGGSE